MGNGQWAMGNVSLSIPSPTDFDHTQEEISFKDTVLMVIQNWRLSG
ncbi:MAG: hypothetical protein KME30_10475 [Iphinoe sp. HA4291-MV1]|nr:hypothetical protein [Iphinoe sp. HA4291-MV1]